MMLLMHSQPGRPLAFAARAAILAIATAAAGCSTEFSRDFPGFSLTDDRKETTTASLQTPSGSGPRGPSYLGNEGRPVAQQGYDRPYVAPGTYRQHWARTNKKIVRQRSSWPIEAVPSERRRFPSMRKSFRTYLLSHRPRHIPPDLTVPPHNKL